MNCLWYTLQDFVYAGFYFLVLVIHLIWGLVFFFFFFGQPTHVCLSTDGLTQQILAVIDHLAVNFHKSPWVTFAFHFWCCLEFAVSLFGWNYGGDVRCKDGGDHSYFNGVSLLVFEWRLHVVLWVYFDEYFCLINCFVCCYCCRVFRILYNFRNHNVFIVAAFFPALNKLTVDLFVLKFVFHSVISNCHNFFLLTIFIEKGQIYFVIFFFILATRFKIY